MRQPPQQQQLHLAPPAMGRGSQPPLQQQPWRQASPFPGRTNHAASGRGGRGRTQPWRGERRGNYHAGGRRGNDNPGRGGGYQQQQQRPNDALTDWDVICFKSRGSEHGARTHTGNLRLHALVNAHWEEYTEAPRGEKFAVAKKVVGIVQKRRGRFLINTRGQWEDVGEDRAILKVRDALSSLTAVAQRQYEGENVTVDLGHYVNHPNKKQSRAESTNQRPHKRPIPDDETFGLCGKRRQLNDETNTDGHSTNYQRTGGRRDVGLVREVAAAADDPSMRLHVDGGEGIVEGEMLDWLRTRLLPLVVLDGVEGEGVIAHIAGERDVSNITGGIRIVPEGIESGHGQVESLGCYKKLDVRVVRVTRGTYERG
jgi:hypothetical protein